MARTNVYGHDEDTGDRRLIGWFDPDKCERFDADTYWNGQNRVDKITRSEWIDATLFRTTGGRWVERTDYTRYHNGEVEHRFLSDDEARDWLLRNEDDEAVAEHFGEVAEESGPGGRPEIGPAVNVRLGDLQERVDAYAAAHKLTRAAAVRELLGRALGVAA